MEIGAAQLKMQNWKMQHQNAGMENAGLKQVWKANQHTLYSSYTDMIKACVNVACMQKRHNYFV